MKKYYLLAVNLVLAALVTGVFWGTWLTLTRSIDVFPPEHFILIGKTIIANVAWPMRIIMPLTLLALLAQCFILWKEKPAFYFIVASFALMLVTLLITLLVEVPIDNQIKTWTVATIPSGWETLRATWSRYHTFRTFTSLLSLVCLVLVVLFGNRRANISPDA